jgi:hypothetical protein
MKRAFVDTSAWYAYVRREDPDHAAVKTALEKWAGRLVTSNFVFDEVVTLTRARLGFSAASRVGQALRDPGVVDLVRTLPEDEDNAWLYFTRRKDKWFSFTDCVSFLVMRRLHLTTALALDEDFRQAGFHVEPLS